jgi:hypothetical protein
MAQTVREQTMIRTRGNRRQKVVATMAIVALSLATTGVSTAGAAAKTSAPGTSTGIGAVAHAKSAVGTYEWFLHGGDQGQITLNSDHSWTAASLGDKGSWLVSGSTVALSDVTGQGGTLMAKVQKHGLSTAKKPGPYLFTGGTSGTWYAVKL